MIVFRNGIAALICFAACFWMTTAPVFGAIQFAAALALVVTGLLLEFLMFVEMWRGLPRKDDE